MKLHPNILPTIEIGTAIRFYREQQHITREALCGDAISLASLQRIESNAQVPKIDMLLYLTRRLCVPIEQLVHFQTDRYFLNFYHQRFKVIAAIEAKNLTRVTNFQHALQLISLKELAVEQQFIVSLYECFVLDGIAELTKQPVGATFKRKLKAIQRFFHPQTTRLSIDWLLYLSLFFKHHRKPLTSNFFKHVKTSIAYLNSFELTYQINTILLREQAYREVYQLTLEKLNASTGTPSVPLVAILYAQLEITTTNLGLIEESARYKFLADELHIHCAPQIKANWHEFISVPKFSHVLML